MVNFIHGSIPVKKISSSFYVFFFSSIDHIGSLKLSYSIQTLVSCVFRHQKLSCRREHKSTAALRATAHPSGCSVTTAATPLT